MRILFVVALMIGHLHSAAGAEVATRARVLEVERSRLKELRGGATTSFIVNVPDGAARSLDTQSRTLQSFLLANVDERPVQFRISSRLGSLDVAIDFELTTRVSVKREIRITVVSQAEVRRRDSDVEAVTVFKGEQVRQEITTAEGASILVTGFVTEREAKRLASIERLRESPILATLLDESRQSLEPVLVLTPQVVSAPIIPEVAISVNPLPTTTHKYTVQVGAFQNEANAGALLAELEKRHPDVFIQKISSGRPVYRVRVGRFKDVQEVRQLEKSLRKEGFNTLVAQLNASFEP